MISAFLLGVSSLLFILFFQVRGIYGGDSGDLVTAACTGGVAHPPGYPLYTFLGNLLCHLPFATASFRVAFLSSIPHVITIVLVYVFILRLTKNSVAALFGSMALLGNYLFFLYSITPEVFALFDLFFMSVLMLLSLLLESYSQRLVSLLAIFFGLSLGNHHVMLFMTPALLFVGISLRAYRKTTSPTHIMRWLGIFLYSAILPYLYIPIAANRSMMINWDRAVDIGGFIKLISRADYGTFTSNGYFGQLLVQRFLQIKAYGEFLWMDLSWIGILLGIVGLVYLWKKQRRTCVLFVITLVSMGPLFLFYASFPLMNRFTLGTFERFLLPSYVAITVLIGIGVHCLFVWFQSTLHKRGSGALPKIFSILLICVCFVYPISLVVKNVRIFSGMSNDKTADNLGIDLLSSVPKHAVVFASRDTSLFISQYVRYVLHVRPDVVLLHFARFPSKEYLVDIVKNFPDLPLPVSSESKDVNEYFFRLIKSRPVFSMVRFAVPEGLVWVPHGLLSELFESKNAPAIESVMDVNKKLFDSYHSPLSGILSRYDHLMLSDVKSVYAASRLNYAKILLKAGKTQESLDELTHALSYQSDIEFEEIYTYMGLSYLFEKKCTQALDSFKVAREKSIAPDKELLLFTSIAYRDCEKDETKASEYLRQYEAETQKNETVLQSL
ncbi:DUF2723 domain-containing protein [Candidatus Gottesmanbacteria bacterium]|nr:DUF2723 domain-containing protein [Candidatus Gottesmanbacteria bacterium]